MYKAYQAEYMDEAKPGYHSTLGVGQNQPDPAQHLVSADGVVIPTGPIVATVDDGMRGGGGGDLDKNEFIVYNEAQVCLRYMIRVGPPRPKRSVRDDENERTEVQWRENEEEEEEDDEEKEEGDDDATKAADVGGKPEEEKYGDEEDDMGEDGSDEMEED